MTEMKKRIFNLVLAGLVIAAPALAANSSTTDGAKPSFSKKTEGCADGACERSGAKAGFSDEQLEKMSKLRNEFLDSTASKRAEIDSLHRQMKDLFKAENIDRAKALELQSKMDSVKADLSKSKLNLRLDQLALLTPEQKQAMRHRMLRGGFGGGKHHGGRFGHHGGGHFKHGGHGAPGGTAATPAAPQEKA